MSKIVVIEGNNNDKDNVRVIMVKGEQGNSIVSVAKTSSTGLIDTYTITFDDGTTSTFNITNGEMTKESTVNIYNTVADMKADTSIRNNTCCKTLGYSSINDGGGADYKITNTLSQTDFQETLNNSLYANLIVGNYAIPETFGVIGDGITDDYNAIKTCIEFANTNNKAIKFTKNYLIKKPSNITKDDYLFIVNCSFFGNGTIKIDNNFGEYKSIFRINTVDNLFFKDITIDQNSENNIVENLQNVGNKSCFSFLSGKNLTIDNIKFLNTCGTWVIEGGGVNYVTINNCKNLNAGIGQTLSYDTSNFYFLGNYITITNNLFEGKTEAIETAIEIESNYKTVSNNIIDGFPTGIIIGSTSSETNAGKSIISNNIIKNCQYGVILWATNKSIKNITISNNQIFPNSQINEATYNQVVGIYFYYPSQYSFENIDINNNLIEYLSSNENANEHSNGIDIAVYYTDTTNFIKNVNIINNTIKNTHGSGICLNTRGEVNSINVQGNIIENWNNGNSTNSTFKNAITIGNDMYEVNDILINSNILKSNSEITNYALLIASRNTINNKINIDNNFFDTSSNLISISNNVGKLYFKNFSKSFNKVISNADINSKIIVGDIQYIYNGANWYKQTSSSSVPTETPENEGDTVLNTNIVRGYPKEYKNVNGTWYPVLQQGYRRQTTTGTPTFNCNYIGELAFNTYDLTWYIGIAIGQSGSNGWKIITS